MTEYVMRIEGILSPAFTGEYRAFKVDLPSFSVNVEKEGIVAYPHSTIQLEVAAAQEHLQSEITPILKVLGAQEGRTIKFEVTHTVLPDRTLKTLSIQARVSLKISPQLVATDELLQKVHRAMVDPIYCDILDLYMEAQMASNPRPAGFRLWERLGIKFGGERGAKVALGVSEGTCKSLFGDQSRYQGDRHAKYPEGTSPIPLSTIERDYFLAGLKKIIASYERHEQILNQ